MYNTSDPLACKIPRFSFTSASRVRKKNLSQQLSPKLKNIHHLEYARIVLRLFKTLPQASSCWQQGMGMASLATSFRMYYSLLSMTSNISQQSPWNGHGIGQMVSLKIDNRKHVFIGRVIVQAYYILMTRLSQNDYFGWKSWFPSTTSSAWTDVVFKMRAAFPLIRSRLCLFCSSVSLLVWLASCLTSLDITVTASPCYPPRASNTTGRNLIHSASQA